MNNHQLISSIKKNLFINKNKSIHKSFNHKLLIHNYFVYVLNKIFLLVYIYFYILY